MCFSAICLQNVYSIIMIVVQFVFNSGWVWVCYAERYQKALYLLIENY